MSQNNREEVDKALNRRLMFWFGKAKETHNKLKMKKQISAEVIADSVNDKGHRITSFVVTFPRIVLAEFNTHRMFSRNSASSRAIPFKKMLKMVQEDPFIPIAFQKDHKGMQGKEYFDKDEKVCLLDYIDNLKLIFKDKDGVVDEELVAMYTDILIPSFGTEYKTRIEWWLVCKTRALECAIMMSCFGVTKQIVNRLLEPFMWHTVIVTATEYENFFHLRCPQYSINNGKIAYRSRKDASKAWYGGNLHPDNPLDKIDEVDWLRLNKAGAEIHASRLAECMWDAYNESTPKELKAGEWHIPFGDNIDKQRLIPYGTKNDSLSVKEVHEIMIKIATARCARVSYMNFEGGDDYEADIKLYDRLSSLGHWSPFEHCAQAMGIEADGYQSGNFVGFRQLRKTFKNENVTI